MTEEEPGVSSLLGAGPPWFSLPAAALAQSRACCSCHSPSDPPVLLLRQRSWAGSCASAPEQLQDEDLVGAAGP